MKNKYILLRHGETKYQAENLRIIYPKSKQFTITLTDKGKKQIKIVAKTLKNKGIDLIYSSDFLRTRQTAEIVAKEVGLKIKFDKRLRDINVGIFHGKPEKEYYRNFSSKKQRFFKRSPQGENWRDVKKRLTSFIKGVEKKHRGKKILVISHGDPLWILGGIIKKLTEKELLERKYEGFRSYKDFYPGIGQYFEFN